MAFRSVESLQSSPTIESSARTYISPDSDRARPRYNGLEPTSLEIALGAHLSDRSFQEYLDILGITPTLLGRNVLDIGSGKHERFSREAAALGITVVSINPQLTEPKVRKVAKGEIEGFPPHQGKSIISFAQALPFMEGKFDGVVAVYSVPYYLKLADYERVLSEILRVLKVEGSAYLAPLATDHLLPCENILDKDTIFYSSQRIPEEIVREIYRKQRVTTMPNPLPVYHRLQIKK